MKFIIDISSSEIIVKLKPNLTTNTRTNYIKHSWISSKFSAQLVFIVTNPLAIRH